MRLDKYLHTNHYTTSRNKAHELILNRKVQVDNKIITKPSYKIENEIVKILEDVVYVSRSAEKLKSFLLSQEIEVSNKKCLDIGSSTGGFVQVLCECGAQSVAAVDVGRDQLHQSIKDDPRVQSYEETNIRDFQSEYCFEFVTCDVSFVGVSYILEDIDRLSCSEIVVLFKPQFEVGRNVKRDKKGVVKDSEAIILALTKFEQLTLALGWKQLIKEYSTVKGKAGNEEIFYYFKK
ncbi:MAG TPA: TlyA family RNA methyltransferase [Campylobacterales bacterium]|nr:TlyA family RNA methyltransferase [Campylobacterales bacterium]